MLMSRTLTIPSRLASCLAIGLCLVANAAQAHSACTWSAEHTPASGVPSVLWGNLKPADTGNLPSNRDSSNYQENGAGGGFEGNPYWASVDAEEGYIFAAAGRRIQIWNANSNPGSPTVEYNIGLSGLTSIVPALVWAPDAHAFIVFRDIDAPPGNSDLFAMVGQNGVGTAIFDSSNKQASRLIYQDHGNGRSGSEVYAASIGGRDYAFSVADQVGGIYVYDMTAASNLTVPCIEAQPGSTACPGVYKGKIGTRSRASRISGAGNFIIISTMPTPRGFEIWNVANPAAPFLVMSGLSSDTISAVEMWQQGSSYYAAVRTQTQVRIYNVSCVASGSCGLGGPLWSQSVQSGSDGRLTFSRSGSTPFLYVGLEFECLSGNQNEYLFDVSNPSSPSDITPQGTAVIGGQAVSYWGWYYWNNGVHGVNRFQPRTGKFSGNYFYRAGKTIFDIHQRTGGSAPVADFSYSPSQIYPGTNVSFTDESIGNPTGWSWSFQPDGSPSTSSTRNPSGIQFAGPGTKTVSLQATNAVGSDTENQNLQVLDPAPIVASVSASPNPAKICQPITFTAVGVTGEPPLSYEWEVKDPSDGTVTGPDAGSSQFVWTSESGQAPGAGYRGEVTISNSTSSVVGTSPSVTLQALDPLPPSGAFAPTYSGQPDPPPTGTVSFNVAASGATEWNWNFGDNPGGGPDGDGYEGWTSDPITGPSPTHSYDATSSYNVMVKVRNCLESERESAAVTVEIISVVQLEASFAASNLFCAGGTCFADVGQAINFNDTSTGDPTAWDYDWDGNGSFEDPNNTSAVTSHTYGSSGSFRPVLRVRRGGATDTFTHTNLIQVGVAPPPPPPPAGPIVTVAGPTSGVVGQQLTFSASAANCTPSGTGWSWSTNGGAASGPTNGSSINLSWSSAGAKTVSATNSSCGTARGTRQVSITSSTSGGSLAANFTFSPTSPGVGDAVTFDAASSAGSPSSFSWQFGDGTPTVSGVTTTHAFSRTGSFQVTLEVGRSDPSCSFGFCSDTVTRTVIVGGSGPPAIDARFNANVPCIGVSGGEVCEAEANQVVTFTDASFGTITSRNWNFGDGAVATGTPTTHSWGVAGSYVVTLTVSDGEVSDTARKTFNVSVVTPPPPPPEPEDFRVLLPWASKSDAALDQVTSLFVHNADSQTRAITMRFHRRRAASDTSPPLEHEITLAAGATAAFDDVLGDPFGLNNVTGFFEFEAVDEDAVLPTVVAYHKTFLPDGTSFGQVVPSVRLQEFPKSSAEDATLLHLQGLNDDTERLAFFGLTNPNDSVARYRLHFYNSLGEEIGSPPAQLAVSPMNLQQMQVERIRNEFGITGVSDYRVEIEMLSEDPVYIYGTNLRRDTLDPAFLRPGDPTVDSVTLLGALAAEGLNGALFRTDVVVANVSGEMVSTEVTYTNVGIGAVSLEPITLTLLPGETIRLRNVLQERWGLSSTGNLGFLVFNSLEGHLPLIQAETYDVANPSGRFGQFMPALTEERIAKAGERQILTGLRQDADFRTTIWMMNPGEESGEYDLIYRALSGAVLGRIDGYRVPPGNMRQLGPGQHPLPDGVAAGGFTVQVIIRSGQLVSASQGVDNATNDPKFIAGRTR